MPRLAQLSLSPKDTSESPGTLGLIFPSKQTLTRTLVLGPGLGLNRLMAHFGAFRLVRDPV